MTNDTVKKKRGRSKGFRSCFRSSGAGDRSFLSEKSDDGDSKSERLGKPVLIAVSDRKGEHVISDVNSVNGDDCYDKRSSSSSRRRFTRVLKAVLFDTAMRQSKKIRGRSCLKSSMASNASLSSFSSEKTGKEDCSDIDDSASRRSYLSSSMTPSSVVSTSSSSSVASNPRSLPDQSTEFRHPVTSNWLSSTKPKHISFNPRSGVKSHLRHQDSVSSVQSKSIKSKQKRSSLKGSPDLRNPVLSNSSSLEKIKYGCYKLNIRLCLFSLLSLFVLVIWGRIFSILCTSTWFYFVPCDRIKRVDSVANGTESIDTDSEQYRKKVIMAGLLERSRNPVR